MQHEFEGNIIMRIQQIGIALRTAFERHRRYYVIRSELEGCSPRMLADLGIARDDIHDLAWKAATKKTPAAGRRLTAAILRPWSSFFVIPERRRVSEAGPSAAPSRRRSNPIHSDSKTPWRSITAPR